MKKHWSIIATASLAVVVVAGLILAQDKTEQRSLFRIEQPQDGGSAPG